MRETFTLQFVKNTLTLVALLLSISINAQVGIGNTNPNTDSLLEIGDATTTTKGMLLPRVNLTGTANATPLTAHVLGMIVYNKNTAGDVTPGFYYNDGTVWIRLSAAANDDWKLLGNTGTTAGTNFIGTTDLQDVVIKSNNLERFRAGATEVVFNEDSADVNLRVETNGDANTIFVDGGKDNIGIGTNNPAVNVKLEVSGGLNNAIYGYSGNVGGYLGRETNITFGVPTQTLLGAGVYANNPYAGYTSTYAQSTSAATVAASVSYSDVWIANYNYVDNNRNSYNPSALYAQLNNTAGVPAYRAGIFSTSNSNTSAASGGIDVGIRAQSVGQNDNTLGVMATTFSDGNDVSGGYFTAATYGGTLTSQSWVANYYFGTDYKIIGSGTVSTLVKDTNDNERIMFAPEAPEVLFQDYGIGKLINGTAMIKIDPVFANNIVVDANHPLKVYVTLEGDCNGIYVTNKSINGFTVKELQNGNSNVEFSWQIVANRKDTKGDTNYADSKYQDLRFPNFNKKDYMPKIKKEMFSVSKEKR